MTALQSWLLWPLIAYLVGAIPFGLMIGRIKGIDIRAHGSGNLGATNVGRVIGRGWGVGCFVLDLLKGAGPVLAFGLLSSATAGGAGENAGGPLMALNWLLVAAGAILGHMFPAWLGFKGGKGVATALGAVLGMWPVLTVPGVVAGLVWLAGLRVSGYVSLASMLAAGAMPMLALGWLGALGRPAGEVAVYVLACVGLAGLVIVRHRSNITRLREGTEPKVYWLGGGGAMDNE